MANQTCIIYRSHTFGFTSFLRQQENLDFNSENSRKLKSTNIFIPPLDKYRVNNIHVTELFYTLCYPNKEMSEEVKIKILEKVLS